MLELHHPPVHAALSVQLLKAEYDLIRQLQSLLQREGAALEAGDATALPTIAEMRTRLTNSLKVATQARLQALGRAGVGPDAASIRQYLESGAATGQVRAAWNRLRLEYARLAGLNRANAVFVETQFRYLQTRWNGLLQSAGGSGVYSRRGEAPAQHRSAALTAAA